MDTYMPIDAKTLSKEEENKALSVMFFLTGKQDGRIKGKKCAVGNKQRTFEGYNKAGGTSPTVPTDDILITTTIYGHKEHDLALMDISGAFLREENDEIFLCYLMESQQK